MKYKASLDNLAKVVTIAVTMLFSTIIIGQYCLNTNEGRAIPIYITIALFVLYFGIFSFRPVSYSITSDKIIIHRPFNDVKIDKAHIKRVELIDKKKLRWSLRTFGVGGLFGYFGRFANMQLGRMTWYVTRRDKPVLIVTIDDKKIIVTPDDAIGFVREFSS